MKDLSRSDQISGTRSLFYLLAGALVVIIVGSVLWFTLAHNTSASDAVRPSGGATHDQASNTGVGTGQPTQKNAQSSVAKNDPAGNEDPTGGRSRAIKQSSEPVNLSDEQRRQVSEELRKSDLPRLDKAGFELMIGVSVPRQISLADLPPRITEIMNGFWGDQAAIVGQSLVIVDQHSRRVAAIIDSGA
ncbi:MAG: hypothetical protein JWP21_1040 [Tardiphaga sp.]|jgi:hypothetical protein|nr:hypothetical protein [Tardiphaga sp.]